MKWYFKAAIHKLLSYFPFNDAFNRFFQEHYGGLNESNIEIEAQLKEIVRIYVNPIIDRFSQITDIRIVEIGTGWIPFLPLTLALVGAQCKTFDVAKHLDRKLLQKTLNVISDHLKLLSEITDLSLQVAEQNCKKALQTLELEEALKEIGAFYEAPIDTAKLPLEDNSQDVTISRLVLQHIPPKILPDVLGELYRIMRPGGISIHRVNLHDEYAGIDPNVTPINFLKYPSWFWDNFGNNSIKYINRDRYPYYLDLFANVGFRVLSLSKKLDKRSLDALSSMKISREFSHYSKEELATIGFNIILEKPSNGW